MIIIIFFFFVIFFLLLLLIPFVSIIFIIFLLITYIPSVSPFSISLADVLRGLQSNGLTGAPWAGNPDQTRAMLGM